MQVELSQATMAEKPIVGNLSQFYLYEFSQYMPSLRLEEHCGLYDRLPDLDAYWNDPNREPFIIRVDGELAGFALVIKGVSDEPHQIGEFFVIQKFVGKGVRKQSHKKFSICSPGTGSFTKCGTTIRPRLFGEARLTPIRTGTTKNIMTPIDVPFRNLVRPYGNSSRDYIMGAFDHAELVGAMGFYQK